MSLNLEQASRLLGVSTQTVERWARQGMLSTRRPTGEPTFELGELQQWASVNGITLQAADTTAATGAPARAPGLAGAIERGGILRLPACRDREHALEVLVESLPAREGFDRARLLQVLKEREAMSTTGLGHGVALPHPRTPSPDLAGVSTVFLALLPEPLEWQAIDGAPVHTLFLLLSPTPAEHLQTLSKVAFLLRDTAFCELLASGPDDEVLRGAVAERELAGP